MTYNSEAEIVACLGALPAAAGDLTWDVIVVDNASNDATCRLVRTVSPQAQLVLHEDNQGFARAVNHGARLAQGHWLLLLNPDTEAAPDCFSALVEAANRRPEAGLVGGRTVSRGGQGESGSAWQAPNPWSVLCFALGFTALSRVGGLRRCTRLRGWLDPETVSWPGTATRLTVDVVSGCLLLVQRTRWAELGGFDQRFLLYGEDLDLSLRARHAGYRPEVVAGAEVVHLLGRSSLGVGARRKAVLTGRVGYFRKHWSPLAASLAVALTIIGVAGRAATRRGRAAGWGDAWAARAQWRRGYPASASASPESGG